MLDIIGKTWKENKTRFLLVAVPVVLMLLAAIFLKGYRAWLVSSAAKLLEGTKKKDEQLKAEAEAADAEAEAHKAQAAALKKKEQEVEAEEGDADWHKKK